MAVVTGVAEMAGVEVVEAETAAAAGEVMEVVVDAGAGVVETERMFAVEVATPAIGVEVAAAVEAVVVATVADAATKVVEVEVAVAGIVAADAVGAV